jgi:hypothetical protein
MAQMPPGDRYAEAARGWLDGVLGELFPELREGLLTRPSTRKISRHWDDGPDGEPGQVRGALTIGMTGGRSRTAVFTKTSWQRFLDSLGKSPMTASLNIRVVGDDGYLSNDEADIRVAVLEEEPGWARFTFDAPPFFTWHAHLAEYSRPDAAVVKVLRWVPGRDEQQVVEREADALKTVLPGPGGGWLGSAELQDRWAASVKNQAARIGARAGLITSRGSGPPSDETVTYPDWLPEMVVQPPEYIQEVAMLGAGLDVLYRYSWVTIIPAELAARLGNAEGLTASGAFFEVSELAGGSVWLRATRTIEEFDQDRSEAVAAVLGPVLVTAKVL